MCERPARGIRGARKGLRTEEADETSLSQLAGREESAIVREVGAESRKIATEKRQGPTARDRTADRIGTKEKKKVENTRAKKKPKKKSG